MDPSTNDTQAQIRQRAFELWEQHGSREGYEAEFWLQAERELKGEASSSTTVAPFVCGVRFAPWPDVRGAMQTRRLREQARCGVARGVWPRGGFPGQTSGPALQPGFVASFLG